MKATQKGNGEISGEGALEVARNSDLLEQTIQRLALLLGKEDLQRLANTLIDQAYEQKAGLEEQDGRET